ncbi:MAG: hypothetical protein WC073_11490 [Sterolibacterium sp.]
MISIWWRKFRYGLKVWDVHSAIEWLGAYIAVIALAIVAGTAIGQIMWDLWEWSR